MRSNTITPAGFTHLKFPNLERLDLQETEVSPQLLTALANLPKLNTLSLSKTHLDEADLVQISKMKTLKSLNLNHSDIGDEDCRILAQMNGLEQLKIGQNPRVTDKGVAYLKSLKTLKLLDLNKTSITDKCVVSLKSLSKLIDLRLYESEISNETCKTLAKMSLQKLYLSDTNIGAPSILSLSKMNSLVYLEIDRNPRIPLAMQAYLADELARRGAVVKIDHGSTGETQPPAKSKYRLEV
jgi:Leucine-rich repeat (LRR) protein